MGSSVEKGSRPVLSQARNAHLGVPSAAVEVADSRFEEQVKGGHEVGRMVGARGKSY
jgi:hypothetical protein